VVVGRPGAGCAPRAGSILLTGRAELDAEFTLAGLRELDPHAPVCHVSYYEADAFARWSGCRLAREDEWEACAARQPPRGNFQEQGVFHPEPATARTKARPRSSTGTRGSGPGARTSATRLPTARGRAGRIQRQVHVRPVRAARRLLRQPRPITSARATGTSSTRATGGSSWESAWCGTVKRGARYRPHGPEGTSMQRPGDVLAALSGPVLAHGARGLRRTAPVAQARALEVLLRRAAARPCSSASANSPSTT
jgi:hypothetical protein